MEHLWAAEPNFIVDYLNRSFDVDASEASLDDWEEFLYSSNNILNIDGEIARISINGVLTQKGPSLVDLILGEDGTAYDAINDALDRIAEMDQIKKVELLVDSPGGEAAGVDEVYQRIMALRNQKEVVAINKGLMASAAYWLSSAADKIFATSPTNETGSIGVVITAVDVSKAHEKMGVKIARIVSRNAPNKVPDIKTKEGVQILQDRADALERIFISRVAEGRGLPIDYVQDNFGKGAVLVASDPSDNKDAFDVKMLDGYFSKSQSISDTQRKVNQLAFAMVNDENGKIECATPSFQDFDIVDKEWDSNSAIRRVREATDSQNYPSRDYRKAFFYYDEENVDNFGAYKLPFVDIVDGRMVAIRRGVFAANAAMSGARTGKAPDIPASERPTVQAHIDRYLKKIEDQEANSMNLKEFLESNSGAKAEYDAALKASFDEGQKEGTASAHKRIEKCSVYLGETEYPASVKNLALQVLKGEEDVAALKGAVVAIDMASEAAKAAAAKLETGQVGDVLANHEVSHVSEHGVINNEIDYQASLSRVKALQGRAN